MPSPPLLTTFTAAIMIPLLLALSGAVAVATVDPLVFQVSFETADKKLEFVREPPFELDSTNGTGDTALPTLSFVCNSTDIPTRFLNEYWMRSKTSYLSQRYAIEEVVVVAPSPPAVASAVALASSSTTTLPVLAAGEVGPFAAVLTFSKYYHYLTLLNALTLWSSIGPDGADLESRISTALFAGAESFTDRAYRTEIVSLSVGIVTTVRFLSDASLTQSPTRSLQQVFDILNSTISIEALVSQLPGCTDVTLVQGLSSNPDAYPSFEQIGDEGQSTYSDQKVGLLVALIVILIVSIVLLVGGHVVATRRMEEKSITEEYGIQG